MGAVTLESLQNPRVKHVVKLRSRRYRDKTLRFLIEGYRELSRAIDSCVPEEVFYCVELFLGENEQALLQQCRDKGAQLYQCSEAVFRKMSYRDRPDGLLATAEQKPRQLSELTEARTVAVVEAIEKPGNLGTILRSADAAGIDALLVCNRCTDIYNPNVVRASVGTLFTVPVFEVSNEEALAWIEEQGMVTVATTPYAEKLYTDASLGEKAAIILGTEQYGLSRFWLDHSQEQVAIPMNGVADSLNVAMAAGLLFYEAVRQKHR